MHRIVMILHQSHLSGRNRNDFISHTVGWKPYSAKKKRPVYRYESRFIRLHSECNSARKHWPPLTEMLHYFGRRCKEPFSLTATTKRNSNNSFSWSGTRKRLFSAPIQTHHTHRCTVTSHARIGQEVVLLLSLAGTFCSAACFFSSVAL